MLCRIVAYGGKMLNELFDGTKGFAIDGGIKDSNHILRLANDVNAPMPTQVRLIPVCQQAPSLFISWWIFRMQPIAVS